MQRLAWGIGRAWASPSLLGPAPSCVSASLRMNVGVLALWLLGCGKAILGKEAFLGYCPSSHVGDRSAEYFAESFPYLLSGDIL